MAWIAMLKCLIAYGDGEQMLLVRQQDTEDYSNASYHWYEYDPLSKIGYNVSIKNFIFTS